MGQEFSRWSDGIQMKFLNIIQNGIIIIYDFINNYVLVESWVMRAIEEGRESLWITTICTPKFHIEWAPMSVDTSE